MSPDKTGYVEELVLDAVSVGRAGRVAEMDDREAYTAAVADLVQKALDNGFQQIIAHNTNYETWTNELERDAENLCEKAAGIDSDLAAREEAIRRRLWPEDYAAGAEDGASGARAAIAAMGTHLDGCVEALVKAGEQLDAAVWSWLRLGLDEHDIRKALETMVAAAGSTDRFLWGRLAAGTAWAELDAPSISDRVAAEAWWENTGAVQPEGLRELAAEMATARETERQAREDLAEEMLGMEL